MTDTAAPTQYDVIAIGNAIVDVMAPCEDALIGELGLNKGGMTLVDTERADELYQAMGPAKEISGGSAANTLAGMAARGRSRRKAVCSCKRKTENVSAHCDA